MATKKSSGGGKKTSPYNRFMKVQLAKLKADQEKSGKKIDHKENFRNVAKMWNESPENPKNKK